MANDYPSLRDSALESLESYMDSIGPDKGKKLAYWLNDYVRFLNEESTFSPDHLIRYKRGAIVKVHLGYRIGSEEGGLHYAIVLDRNNSIHSPTLTVIPLTSVKPGVDLTHLPRHRVSIGNEVYTLLLKQYTHEINTAKSQLEELKKCLSNTDSSDLSEEETKHIQSELTNVTQRIEYCKKMKRETDKMKIGSIALVGQITTISKIRIYDPKFPGDALSRIRISPKTLDILDARIQELYGAPVNS